MVEKLEILHRTVQDDEAGQRLDRWLRQAYPALTQGQIEKLLRTGQIRVEGKRAEGKTRLLAWQSVRLPPLVTLSDTAEAQAARAERRTLPSATRLKTLLQSVIYEDEDIVAIDKPQGLAVQGGTGIKKSLDDELAAFMLPGATDLPKLVHRLDRETSGVLLLARTPFAARALTAAFRLRATEKYYLALVAGLPEAPSGVVQAPLLKRSDGRVMAMDGGQSASSDFFVIEQAHRTAAALLLQPHTGRTHQLRVHCEVLGCPILGDPLYHDERSLELAYQQGIERLQLHAWRLRLPHPRDGARPLDLTAPLPKLQRDAWRAFGFTPLKSGLDLDRLLVERELAREAAR